ncbi:MAG: hypothetical protein Kow001_02110 [Acidobacteriota bacterium]
MDSGPVRSRIKVSLGACFLVVIVVCTALQGGSSLIFPRISREDQTLTGLAFVNTSSQPAIVRITLYDAQGSLVQAPDLVNPAEVEIAPGRQLARTVAELLHAPLDPGVTGWIEAVSESDGITGFYLYLNFDVSIFDGADGPSASRKIVFSLVGESDQLSSEFNLVNPFAAGTDFEVRLHRPGAEPLTASGLSLPPKGVFRFSLPSLFGTDSAPSGSYLSVLASGPLAGFEFVREAGGDIIGLNAPLQAQGLGELYFPQMAVLGPWSTELGLVNHGSQAALVTVYAYRPDGTLYGAPHVTRSNPAVIAMEAEQGTVRDVAELFGFSGEDILVGWLKVESTSARMAGFVNYGLPASGSWASVAAQVQPLTGGIFSHIATTLGYFTGVAVLNPSTLATRVRISAYSGDGELLGRHTQVLQPGQRDSRLITEYVGDTAGKGSGFIQVDSERPVFMTSLFGTERILANIPPQPAGLESSGPGLRVEPPLAVAQPGKPLKFKVQGIGGPVAWNVVGESSQTGSIDAAGNYTAPAQIPARLPLTITAAVDDEIAAASVDVLRKEQLLAEVGVVQAVAYLRGLERLYSAELTGSAAQLRAGIRAQQEAPASRIASVAPGARVELAEFPGEVISKMIPFQGSRGGRYLLLLSKSAGRVIRFDPVTRTQVTVVQGLQSPDSMVFDDYSGNLLVADQSTIRVFSRELIESGTGVQGASAVGAPLPRQQDAGEVLTGIAVDLCTGNLVVSDQTLSAVVTIDRSSGERSVLSGDVEQPGELLALYRVGTHCPEAFHLLVSDSGSGRTRLVSPGLGVDLEWLGDRNVADLAFLPDGNPVTGSPTVVFAELPATTLPGAVSSLSEAGTLALYSDRPGNPPESPSGSRYGDSPFDSLQEGDPVDLLALEVQTSEAEAVVFLLLSGTTWPSVDLAGHLDFDSDRNPLTGTTSHVDQFTAAATGLGVDSTLDLGSYRPDTETAAFLDWNGSAYEEAAQVAVSVTVNPAFLPGTTLIRIGIPLELLGGDRFFHLAAEVGDLERVMDVAPNRGYIRVGVGP